MGDESSKSDALAHRAPDYVASAARAALGAVPFAGSLLAEVAGSIIPNQRIERLVSFARELEARLSEAEQQQLRSNLTNENFTDLLEDAIRQAARSVTQQRRARIATLIKSALKPDEVAFVESKQFLRLLGEVSDVEMVRLGWHLFEAYGDGSDYWEQHRDVLEPATPHFGALQQEQDRHTIQQSFDEHLCQLGLLVASHNVDSKTGQVVVDRHSGEFEVRGYRLSALGRLFLKHVGVEVDEKRANLRMEPTRR